MKSADCLRLCALPLMQVAERLRPCAPPMKYAETLRHCVPAIMKIADNRWLCAPTERRRHIFQPRRAVTSHNGICQARRRWRRETFAPQLSSPASMSAVAVPQTCDPQLTPLIFRDRKKTRPPPFYQFFFWQLKTGFQPRCRTSPNANCGTSQALRTPIMNCAESLRLCATPSMQIAECPGL